MSEPEQAAAPQPTRRAVIGWVLYDLANTLFAMGVVSTTFSLWVRDQVGKERVDSVVGMVTAVSMAIVFCLAPILGAMADRGRRRMPFLLVSTMLCILGTALLGRAGYAGTLVLFAFANIAYQAGQQFYDALLPSVATPERRGKVGGLGVGIGYFGSFLAIGLGLLAPRLGWDKPMVFLVIALLFLGFSWPCFLWVKERENPQPTAVFSLQAIGQSLRQTGQTLRDTRQHPGLLRFLIGRVFYTDPVNTVISVMMLYSVNVAVQGGLTDVAAEKAARLVMLQAILFAILGGVAWGHLVDRLGPRRVLGWVLWLWMGTFALGALMAFVRLPAAALSVVGILTGLCLGGTWTADRPLMLELTPPARVGEFYGLYGMVGRFAAVIGPLIWGLVFGFLTTTWGTKPLKAQGVAILVLLLLVVASRVILAPLLKERRAPSQ